MEEREKKPREKFLLIRRGTYTTYTKLEEKKVSQYAAVN